jgi:response regulator RpfG family c-di-GMP phosphodiesterase
MTEGKKLGKILIVDDDKIIVKLLSRIFEKYCDIKTAYSGEEGLDILKDGYNPGVILSDQIMPGILGSEFLNKSLKYVPDAKRIILTGNQDLQNVMEVISEAKAFMYLVKPFDNIALIKNVSNAFEEYNMRREMGNKIKDYERRIEKYERRIKGLVGDHDLNEETLAIINQMHVFANNCTKYYFRPGLSNIVVTCKYLADQFDLSDDETDNLIFAAFIQGVQKIGVDDKFHLLDPVELSSSEQQKYRNHFLASFASLKDNFNLAPVADVCMKMWEKPTGTGFPDRLKADRIPVNAILLNLAVKYENLVYRLDYGDLRKLKENGEIVQTYETTEKRHKEAILELSKNLSYYEQLPVKAFKHLVTYGDCPSLKPVKDNLVLKLK